jgi:hypothetical protein
VPTITISGTRIRMRPQNLSISVRDSERAPTRALILGCQPNSHGLVTLYLFP